MKALKSIKLYDTQRASLYRVLRPVFAEKPFVNLPPLAEILHAWQSKHHLFQEMAESTSKEEGTLAKEEADLAKEQSEQEEISLPEQDELVDACVKALDAGLDMAVHWGIATEDEAVHEQAKSIQKKLFSRGTGVIVDAPQQAETGMVEDLCTYCNRPDVSDFLKKRQLWPIVELMAIHNTTMREMSTKQSQTKSQKKTANAELKAARDCFDDQLHRLVGYLSTTYKAEDPEEKALQEIFFTHIREAQAAAEQERKVRAEQRAKKRATKKSAKSDSNLPASSAPQATSPSIKIPK